MMGTAEIRKLTASVAEQNVASFRVLEKAGYIKDGLLTEHYLVQNIPTNEVIFGLLRNECNKDQVFSYAYLINYEKFGSANA